MVHHTTPARDRVRLEGYTMLTLGQAARLTGTSKTTLTRAIKAGRLSAARQEDGSYRIDPAELHRVYEVKPETPATVTATGDVVHRTTPTGEGDATPETPDVTARMASLDAEVKGLRELLAEVKESRDQWRQQAERLALTGPATPARRPWWKRLAG
jgi:excisionase family DNA binding protein